MQTKNTSHEQEFFDITFYELNELNAIMEVISQELKSFEKSNLINLIHNDRQEVKLRSNDYFTVKEFLSRLSHSNKKTGFLNFYRSGFLLWTTLSPNLDYFDCFNREIDTEFIQILAELKLAFAYTIQL